MNQALFVTIWVDENGVVRSQLAEPFASLLACAEDNGDEDGSITEALNAESSRRTYMRNTPARCVRGVKESYLVDLSRSFSHPRPAVNTLVRRVLRCGSARQRRSRERQITDSRGLNVRELRMSQTLLRPEQVADLVDEYRQGVPVRELAERYGVHRQTVSDHARRHGLAPRHRTLNADERALVVSLRQDGSTLNEIAERVQVSERTVRNILKADRGPKRARDRDTAAASA